jgi:hypothetical protein
MAANVKKEPSSLWHKNMAGFWFHHATTFGLGQIISSNLTAWNRQTTNFAATETKRNIPAPPAKI